MKLNLIHISVKLALEPITLRSSTWPFQASGARTSVDIYHGLQDPHDDGDQEGICYINVGSFLIILVITDRMPLLEETVAIFWDLYGVLPVYSGQITIGEHVDDTHTDFIGKKRPLDDGTSSEGSRPRI